MSNPWKRLRPNNYDTIQATFTIGTYDNSKDYFLKSDSDQSDLIGSDLKDVMSDIDEHMIILDAQNISESIRQIKKEIADEEKKNVLQYVFQRPTLPFL